MSLLEIKLSGLAAWEIDLEKGDPIAISEIDHFGHNHLAPFHLTNSELLTYYNGITIDGSAAEKESAIERFEVLQQIKHDPTSNTHENTVCHCTDHPFGCISYREVDRST